MVTPFRPRIGKEKVTDGNRSGRQERAERGQNFHLQHARVRQPSVADFPTNRPHPSWHAFHAEKIPLRKLGRERCQERAITASEIDLQRRRTVENGAEIERLLRILQSELCVGKGSSIRAHEEIRLRAD